MLQLDLAALPVLPSGLLPNVGLLQLFVGEGRYEDEPVAAVAWQREASPGPVAAPEAADDLVGAVPVVSLSASLGLALADQHGWAGNLLLGGVESGVLRRFSEALGDPDDRLADRCVRVLGHSEDWRQEPQVFAAGETTHPERRDPAAWMALFVFRDWLGWSLDATFWHVMIHRDDLRARRFDRVVMTYCR